MLRESEISLTNQGHKLREKNVALSPFFGLQNIENSGIFDPFVIILVMFGLFALSLNHMIVQIRHMLVFVFAFHEHKLV